MKAADHSSKPLSFEDVHKSAGLPDAILKMKKRQENDDKLGSLDTQHTKIVASEHHIGSPNYNTDNDDVEVLQKVTKMQKMSMDANFYQQIQGQKSRDNTPASTKRS